MEKEAWDDGIALSVVHDGANAWIRSVVTRALLGK